MIKKKVISSILSFLVCFSLSSSVFATTSKNNSVKTDNCVSCDVRKTTNSSNKNVVDWSDILGREMKTAVISYRYKDCMENMEGLKNAEEYWERLVNFKNDSTMANCLNLYIVLSEALRKNEFGVFCNRFNALFNQYILTYSAGSGKLNGIIPWAIDAKDGKMKKELDVLFENTNFKNINITKEMFDEYKEKMLSFFELEKDTNRYTLEFYKNVLEINEKSKVKAKKILKYFSNIQALYIQIMNSPEYDLIEVKKEFLEFLKHINRKYSSAKNKGGAVLKVILDKVEKLGISSRDYSVDDVSNLIDESMCSFLRNGISKIKRIKKVLKKVEYSDVRNLHKNLKVEKELKYFDTNDLLSNLSNEFFVEYFNSGNVKYIDSKKIKQKKIKQKKIKRSKVN